MTVGEPTLASDLTNLLASGQFADVRIVGKDGEVLAHKVVLATRCPAMLEEGVFVADEEGRQGRVLKFPTLDAEVIQEFVQALYSNVLAIVRERRPADRRARVGGGRGRFVGMRPPGARPPGARPRAQANATVGPTA